MRVLITGGAGFVGSHLCRGAARARRRGLRARRPVHRLDRQHRPPQGASRASTTRSTRSTNEPLLAELIDRCDIVVHLAAAVGVKLIVEPPVHTIETNVHGTEVVLKHANKKKKLVLIASTSEVYGKSTDVPFREDADLVLGPDVEAPLGLRLQQDDRRVPGARLLEGAQAAGDRRPALQHRRPAADRAVRDGDPELRAAGARRASRSPCSATARSRAASPTSATSSAAMVALIDEPRAVGQVFNIGNGEEISIGDLADADQGADRQRVRRSCTIPYDQAYEAGFEDMPRRVPDISKIRALVGYEPTRRARRDPRRASSSHFRQQ